MLSQLTDRQVVATPFAPASDVERGAVQTGELGFVHTVRANTHDQSPPPADYLPTSGGLFRDCSVHDFDIIRFVTGREVVSVYAVGVLNAHGRLGGARGAPDPLVDEALEALRAAAEAAASNGGSAAHAAKKVGS